MHEKRKKQIFNAIVEHFIETAQPVGSQTIITTYNFRVSPATVRNDMATLEKEGLVFQPHTSSGRVPTNQGYQLYVNELADFALAKQLAKQTLDELRKIERVEIAKQRVNEAVALLSQASPNMAFATIPENDRTFFMGLSKILKQPEFLEHPLQASQVMEVIEERKSFLAGLNRLELGDEPKILIGDNDILPGIDSCSLIVAKYSYEDFEGFIGILGPKRMPYAYNFAILGEVRDLLQNKGL